MTRGASPTSDLLSTADAARLLGLSEARIRSFVRSGLCRPLRRGRAYAFSFRDLVVLHAARRLLRDGVAPARVQRALRALAAELPEGHSLSELRLGALDGLVTVREDGATWDAETGQAHLDFEPLEPAPRVGLEPAPRVGLEPAPRVGLEPARRVGVEPAPTLGREAAAQPGLDAAPDSPEGGGEGLLQLRVGEVAALVREFRAQPPGPEDAAGEFRRALSLEEVDEKAAAEAYRRALALDPDLADALVNLGRLHHEAGDLEEATSLYQRALERDPLDPIVHFNLALTRHDADGPAAAVPHYERALALDAEFADAHFNLARVYEELGRRADALRHYAAYQRLSNP